MLKNLLLLITLFYSHVLYGQLCEGTYLEINYFGNSTCQVGTNPQEPASGDYIQFALDASGNWVGAIPSGSTIYFYLNINGNNITIPQQPILGGFMEGQGLIVPDGTNCPYIQITYIMSNGFGGVQCNLLSLVYQGGAGNPCSTPSGLLASNISNTSATLSWDNNPNAIGYAVQARQVGMPEWVLVGDNITENSFTLNGLNPCSNYEFQTVAYCNNAMSGASTSGFFTTTGCGTGNTYCEVMGNDVDYEWIDRVTIGNMNNLSGADDGYGDYTATTINVTRGNTYPIALYPAFSTDPYTEYWRIWIDYNHDNDFDDSNEQVFDSGSASSSSVTGNITVPTNVQLGNARMRVMMKWVDATDDPALPTPCLSFGYGEVEDYTVSINNMPTAIDNPSHAAPIAIQTNPTSKLLTIRADNIVEPAQLYLYDSQGKQVQATNLQSNAMTQIDLRQFPAGIYIVQVVHKGIFYAEKIVLLK